MFVENSYYTQNSVMIGIWGSFFFIFKLSSKSVCRFFLRFYQIAGIILVPTFLWGLCRWHFPRGLWRWGFGTSTNWPGGWWSWRSTFRGDIFPTIYLIYLFNRVLNRSLAIGASIILVFSYILFVHTESYFYTECVKLSSTYS